MLSFSLIVLHERAESQYLKQGVSDLLSGLVQIQCCVRRLFFSCVNDLSLMLIQPLNSVIDAGLEVGHPDQR